MNIMSLMTVSISRNEGLLVFEDIHKNKVYMCAFIKQRCIFHS